MKNSFIDIATICSEFLMYRIYTIKLTCTRAALRTITPSAINDCVIILWRNFSGTPDIAWIGSVNTRTFIILNSIINEWKDTWLRLATGQCGTSGWNIMKSFAYKLDKCYYLLYVSFSFWIMKPLWYFDLPFQSKEWEACIKITILLKTSNTILNAYVYKHLKMGNKLTKTV